MTTLAPSLTPTEERLLAFFKERRGRTLAAWLVYEGVWGVAPQPWYDWKLSLKVYICRLRRKTGVTIKNERGYGYRMV